MMVDSHTCFNYDSECQKTVTSNAQATLHRYLIPIVFLAVLLTSILAMAQDDGAGGNKQMRANDKRPGMRSGQQRQPLILVPTHPVDVIIGRPTDTSIVLSVLCNSDSSAFVAYGTQAADLANRTEVKSFRKGAPEEVILEKLKPNTRYYYRLIDVTVNKPVIEGAFHTQRPPGSTFTFTVTADSHLDQNTDTELYQRTLKNALADTPDFHIDLGDTFMTDKHESRENAASQYLAQRFYLGEISRSAPLFLVLGNHDGEDSKLFRGGAESLAVWSNAMRKRYFPNPIPNGFYSGNVMMDKFAGLLQDYYAWEWGDALFIVLNPYWHSSGRRSEDSWGITLGNEQYKWLARTLVMSKARFKFVFVHQLVGGFDRQGRGGVEAVPFGEWGGKNADGTDGFKDNRPGWDHPIHKVLVNNHVTVVFHGHDHLFAKQDMDGIVYQEVPQPGFPRSGIPRAAAEYGYREGVILGSSGYMRVTVSPNKVTVDYVQVYAAKDGHANRSDRQVSHSYTIER